MTARYGLTRPFPNPAPPRDGVAVAMMRLMTSAAFNCGLAERTSAAVADTNGAA